MGTTGGDRKALEQTVIDSQTVAVIAPNMAKQIVALQKLMSDFAESNQGLFDGYELKIEESHQSGKADTSGTAKAMVGYFNKLGISFTPDKIKMIRDPQVQRKMGIREQFLDGHGWHNYEILPGNYSSSRMLGELLWDKLEEFVGPNSKVFEGYKFTRYNPENAIAFERTSTHGNVTFAVALGYVTGRVTITHNVNGRGIYAAGTMDALRFLREKVAAGERGKVYSMIDVLNAQK